MNATAAITTRPTAGLLATAIAAIVAAGCASTPTSPTGAAEVRQKLSQLEADPALASRAPVAMKEAATAVRLAEEPLVDEPELGAHRVYIADRKVEIARARAETRAAEDQRATMAQERESARLAARTREADEARSDASTARADADAAGRRADAEAAELERQIAALKAEATERGLVLTLGDVLFATGQSDLKPGATRSLDQLVVFLKRYPARSIAIEGHTDNVGSEVSNQGLSERRANTVKGYLVRQGIDTTRLSAAGLGESQPVADNATSYGRQQNRRVVLIISEPVQAAADAVAP